MAGLAVVLSGGGAKGAFQVGVLDELARRGFKADIWAGVSTGAIQALAGAQGDVPKLVEVWRGLRGNGDIYRERPLGLLGGLLGAPSLFDAAPLRARLRLFADEAKLRAGGAKLLLGVVNLQSGQYRSVHENTPRIADWVYASCAQPPAFAPLTTRDAAGVEEQWVDGGVRDVTPLGAVLEWNPRAVLVVLASPMRPQPAAARQYTSLLPIALRSVGILTAEVMANDVGQVELINGLIAARAAQAGALAAAGVRGPAAAAVLAPLDAQISRYRFAPVMVIAPEREFSDTLEFEPANIAAAMAAGRAAAAARWTQVAAWAAAA